MNIVLLSDKNNDLSLHCYIILKNTYRNHNIHLISVKDIKNINLSVDDLVILFNYDYFQKVKNLGNFINSRGAKFGMFFGDSLQYFDLIYKQFGCLIDFCFTHEMGESAIYESLLGIPSFDHPLFAIRDTKYILEKNEYLDISKRDIIFTHLGLIDARRHSRTILLESLNNLNLRYKLYGPQKDLCDYLSNDQIQQKLSKCIFGLVPCAASTSNSLTTNEKYIKYQFKGKIWEYMFSGCIPVIDHAPLADKSGLKDSEHYLSVSSFNHSELKRLSKIDMVELSEISKNCFQFSQEKLSLRSFKLSFDYFLNNLLKKKFKAKDRIILQNPSQIEIASLEYSILEKKFSYSIFASNFYFIKLINISIRFFLKLVRRKSN
tara:strand:- start:295 stop:1425 length:1131 start_codon:yes stop_codon:yes gene_type:complete